MKAYQIPIYIFIFLLIFLPPQLVFQTEAKNIVLSLPYIFISMAIVLCVGFYIIWPKRKSEIKRLVVSTPLIAILVLVPIEYVLLDINALFPKGERTIVGTIINLDSEYGYKAGTSYYVEVFDEELNKQVRFKVSSRQYQNLSEGEVFTTHWKVGLFGLLYR